MTFKLSHHHKILKILQSLQIDNIQIPKIIDGIDLLANDLDLTKTKRTFKELY